MNKTTYLLFQNNGMSFYRFPIDQVVDPTYPIHWLVNDPSNEFIDWVNSEFDDRNWRSKHEYQCPDNIHGNLLILMLTNEGAMMVKLRWCVNE
jgi:hypothetical protein